MKTALESQLTGASPVHQDPDRKSLHQAYALPLVSRSTSSVLPSRKDSASESSSPTWGLGVRSLWIATSKVPPTRFFSTAGPVSSVFMQLKSTVPGPAMPLLLLILPDCIMSFLANSKGSPSGSPM
ncbi:hypothetical protein NL108_012330 [Boleophthalmus pectinirostris]|nr:hypothetical protein NL108_012330 [Boleophthalmus pectinirostris]